MPETTNFYAGNQLNRLSWLRSDNDFLNRTITEPSSRFILLQNLNPLVHKDGPREGLLATLTWPEVKEAILESAKLSGADHDGEHVFGPDALGLYAPSGSDADEKTFKKMTEGLVPNSLALVFLGVDERNMNQASLPGQLAAAGASDKDGGECAAGTAHFALSLTFRPVGLPSNVEMPTKKLEKSLIDSGKYDFVDTRALAQLGIWDKHDAAMVAQARSMIDWAERYQYCPSCSRRQYGLWAGYKRACASSLGAAGTDAKFAAPFLRGAQSFELDGKGPCSSAKGLNNYSYPRTDSTIIAAIASPDGERVLLGRQKKWPPGFVSCLAGFIEPGESWEEAVRREIFEEAGIVVQDVIFHSSQPWPFPANLMLGAIGRAAEGQDTIRLDLDNELEEAKWYSREDVLLALEKSANWSLSKRDLARIDENVAQQQKEAGVKFDDKDSGSVANVLKRETPGGEGRAKIKLPGPTAIAHTLVAAWARGEVPFPDARKGKM